MTDQWREWNDGSCLKFIQEIYDSRRWEIMPILADALEDAGFDDQATINLCRKDNDEIGHYRTLALIVNPESVKWIDDFCDSELGVHGYEDNIPAPTYYEVMKIATKNINNDNPYWGNYITQIGGTRWQDMDMSEFWHHYEIVMGVKVKDPTVNFFGCSC